MSSTVNQIHRSQNNLKVLVHPLVIMNCADHCNRSKYIEPRRTRVIGVLLGKQEGREVELINSVELSFTVENGKNVIDEAFTARRLAAYKTMFPNLDCLGWYTTGSEQKSDCPEDADLDLQKTIQKFCENPILLVMNVNSEVAASKKKVPIFIYETNQNANRFEQLDFQLSQSDDERIAVDHVTKAVDQNAKKSTVSTSMSSSVNAIKLLRSKILFLIDIFEKSPAVKQNPAYTRRLNQICCQIDLIDHALKQNEKQIQESLYSDVAASNLLASATKGFQDLNSLIKEINMVGKQVNGKSKGSAFGNIMQNQQDYDMSEF